MKKIYVVCEDYYFFGLYVDEKEAKENADFINEYILEYPYTIENNKPVVDLKENSNKEFKKVMENLYFHEKWRKEEIEYLNKQYYYMEEEKRQWRKFGAFIWLVIMSFALLIGIPFTTCA